MHLSKITSLPRVLPPGRSLPHGPRLLPVPGSHPVAVSRAPALGSRAPLQPLIRMQPVPHVPYELFFGLAPALAPGNKKTDLPPGRLHPTPFPRRRTPDL